MKKLLGKIFIPIAIANFFFAVMLYFSDLEEFSLIGIICLTLFSYAFYWLLNLYLSFCKNKLKGNYLTSILVVGIFSIIVFISLVVNLVDNPILFFPLMFVLPLLISNIGWFVFDILDINIEKLNGKELEVKTTLCTSDNSSSIRLQKRIQSFFDKSENLREGYLQSLQQPNLELLANFKETFPNISVMFSEIYSFCNGTPAEIKSSTFFDFIPGFRLMQLEEIFAKYKDLSNLSKDFTFILPFLTDDSDCFYSYAFNTSVEKIVYVSDTTAEIIYDSVEDFWTAINASYKDKIYSLDEAGFLIDNNI